MAKWDDEWKQKFVDSSDTTEKQRLGRKMADPVQMGLYLGRSLATVGHGVINLPRAFGNVGRGLYNMSIDDEFAKDEAFQNAGDAAEEAWFGKHPGENTIANVLEAYTTDVPEQLFRLMDFGKEKYNDLYRNIFGTEGSIPPGPKPDRTR